MAYPNGSQVFVDYGEVPQVVHSRSVLSHIQNDDYVICTPDLDIYTETLSRNNPDYVDFPPSLPGGGIPPALAGVNVYNFGALTATDYAGLLQAGRDEADAERARLGIGAPPLHAGMAAPAAGAGSVGVSRICGREENRGCGAATCWSPL